MVGYELPLDDQGWFSGLFLDIWKGSSGLSEQRVDAAHGVLVEPQSNLEQTLTIDNGRSMFY